MAARILIADDNEPLSQLLEIMLIENGYEVVLAANGDELLRKAQASVPDLMLVDIIMPNMDGYEAIRQLRNDTRLAHIPIIVLTARTSVQDVVTGFETGADDYVTKPFQMQELLARVKAQLTRAKRRPVQNPLTGLPGNTLIEEEINHRLRISQPFALLYIDLDNFKAFNDAYGFARGDLVIKLMAHLLADLRQQEADDEMFLGHIGGDDFAVLLPLGKVEPFCERLIHEFESQVPALYDAADIERGYLAREDHYHVMRQIPLQTVSIGVVTTKNRMLTSYHDISRVAAEMKHLAKRQSGSVYVIDRRSRKLSISPERRKQRPMVYVLGADTVLKSQVLASLGAQTLVLGTDAPGADSLRPDFLVLVGQLDPQTTQDLATIWPDMSMISITPDESANAAPATLSVRLMMKPKVPLGEYLALAMHLLRLEAR
jgi:diguanylate cyclase (GGDEF)-like protein